MNGENQKKKGFPGRLLFFSKVRLFEIVFVGVTVCLFFFILNYFNIISLSQIYPRQLGFLPHRPFSQAPRTASGTPSAVPETAKREIKNLIDDLILPSLIPANIGFQKQDIKNPNHYSFYGTGWAGRKNETFIPAVEYDRANNLIGRQILVIIPRTMRNLTGSSSSALSREYLKITPPSPFFCAPFPLTGAKSILCESFWKDANGIKRGIDITSPVEGSNGTQLLYCEHRLKSPDYSWKSCYYSFKDSGIK